MSVQDVKSILKKELQYFWSVDQIKTRFDVVNYCVGRFEKIDETIIDAVNALYCERYIKE